MQLEGVVHTAVVHRKKKIRGKWVLLKYVVEEKIALAGGECTVVKKGAQYIRGWWQKLRKTLKGSLKLDTKTVIEHVRIAQWRSWHRGKDWWLEAGETIKRVGNRP